MGVPCGDGWGGGRRREGGEGLGLNGGGGTVVRALDGDGDEALLVGVLRVLLTLGGRSVEVSELLLLLLSSRREEVGGSRREEVLSVRRPIEGRRDGRELLRLGLGSEVEGRRIEGKGEFAIDVVRLLLLRRLLSCSVLRGGDERLEEVVRRAAVVLNVLNWLISLRRRNRLPFSIASPRAGRHRLDKGYFSVLRP